LDNVTFYSSKEMTAVLGIADSSLRKWCLALEEQQYYFFSRTDNNRRLFTDRDRIVLKKFRELVQVQSMSIQNSAIIVAAKYKDDAFEQTNSENGVIDNRSGVIDLAQMKHEIEQLKDLNRELLKRLDERDKYIDERMGKRDSRIMASLKELKETKKLTFEEEKGKVEVVGTLTKMLEEERASNRETQRLLLERVEQLEKTGALKVKQATSTKLHIDDQEKNDDNVPHIVDQRMFEKEEAIDLWGDPRVESGKQERPIEQEEKRPFWKRLFK
jgi:DNA-binding transcriptional MerR regulator